MPVYNGENFIAAAIDSVLSQDFTDFELSISDNGSTDRTPEICTRYAAADRRVRYYRSNTNQGGAWNFNRVFALSTAPLFKWHAHDDICLPGFFRKCVAMIEQAPQSVVVVYPKTVVTDESGKVLSGYFPERLDTRRAKPHQRLADVLRNATMVSAQFGIIRQKALRQTRMFNPMIAADFILIAELAVLGEVWELDEVLFQRRIHARISTRANSGNHQLLQWWDPSQRHYRWRVSPMMLIGWEVVRSVQRLSLRPSERFLCSAAALLTWYHREFRNIGGRFKVRLRQQFLPQPAH
jgi:glycosyltransferase involved in cell wall biosynthesis